MKWAETDPANPTLISLLRDKIAKEEELQRVNPDPFRRTAPREEHYLAGKIQLGSIPQLGFPYGIDPEMLVTHLLILGITGGGKTTVIKNLLKQVLERDNPPKLMILERKQEFTELLHLMPDMHVLEVNTLEFNPLRPPPGVELNKWLGIFTECMVNFLDIREASSSFLMDHALRLRMAKQQLVLPGRTYVFHFLFGISVRLTQTAYGTRRMPPATPQSPAAVFQPSPQAAAAARPALFFHRHSIVKSPTVVKHRAPKVRKRPRV